jgi:5-methylcytosine-specific restriction endonuclease McrA
MLLPKPKRVRLSPEEYAKQRTELFEKYGWRCAKCGRLLPLQRDHIKKRSQGGGDEDANAQPLCPECHNSKDNVAKSKSYYWNAQTGELHVDKESK